MDFPRAFCGVEADDAAARVVHYIDAMRGVHRHAHRVVPQAAAAGESARGAGDEVASKRGDVAVAQHAAEMALIHNVKDAIGRDGQRLHLAEAGLRGATIGKAPRAAGENCHGSIRRAAKDARRAAVLRLSFPCEGVPCSVAHQPDAWVGSQCDGQKVDAATVKCELPYAQQTASA